MTVQHVIELAVDAAGTPDEVWRKIATPEGLASWTVPATVEEGAGGTIVFDLGDGWTSVATIAEWDPPRRLVYEEDWATLTGNAGAAVSVLRTEFDVEPKPGGDCLLRVSARANGTGAAWEHGFFAHMRSHWVPMFDALRG